MADGRNFAVEFIWNNNISHNVQTLAVIKKYKDSPKKKISLWNDWSLQFCSGMQLKLAVFSNFSIFCCFLEKINSFPEKLWTLLKKAKGSNFAVESEWKTKFSQNVQSLFCF